MWSHYFFLKVLSGLQNALSDVKTRIHIYKRSRDHVDKITDQLHLSVCIPQCKFQIHVMSGNVQVVIALRVIAIYTCTNVSYFYFKRVKMFLSRLQSELQKLIKQVFQDVLRYKQNADWISTKLNAQTPPSNC